MEFSGFFGQPNGHNKNQDAFLLRALNDRFTKTDLSALTKDVGCGGNEGRRMLTLSLRFLVDKWIDSARNENAEFPWKRQPWRGPLRDYMKRHPPELFFTADGLCLFAGTPRNAPDESRVLAWFQKCVEEMRSKLPDGQSLDDAKLRKVLCAAADLATALYLRLLDSPIRTRLFRCDGCRTYFHRQRMPKKDGPIERGSWCAKCKGKGSARRTDKSRQNRTNQMIGWAADAWMEWQPNQPNRYGELAEWVRLGVNKRMPKNWGLLNKTNWVTGHWDKIQEEVDRRKHAKG